MTGNYFCGRLFVSLSKPLAVLVVVVGACCSLWLAAKCASTAGAAEAHARNSELEASIQDFKDSYDVARGQVAEYLRSGGVPAWQAVDGVPEFRATSCDSLRSLEEQREEITRAAAGIRRLKLSIQRAYSGNVDFLVEKMRDHVNKTIAEKMKTGKTSQSQSSQPAPVVDAPAIPPGGRVLDIDDKDATRRLEALGEISKTLRELLNLSTKEDSRAKVKAAIDEVARGVKFIDCLNNLGANGKDAKERMDALPVEDRNRIEAESYLEKLASSKRQFAEALCASWLVDKRLERVNALLDAEIAACKIGRVRSLESAGGHRVAVFAVLAVTVLAAIALVVLGDVFKALFDLAGRPNASEASSSQGSTLSAKEGQETVRLSLLE